MGIGTRIAEFFTRGVSSEEKSYTLPTSGSGSGVGFAAWLSGHAAMTGTPHEPFAGAWQRNLDQVASAGPNVYANSVVFSCTNVISSDIAVLRPRILRVADNGIRAEHTNHPNTSLLANPNSYQTTLQFIQQYLTSKLTNGNTYVLLMRDSRFVVNEMHVINPTRVQPLVSDDGNVFYKIGKDSLANIPEITVPARDMLHDRAMTLWHPLVGMSPLFAAGMSAMMAARMEMASEQFFANMARTSGVLVAPGKIEPAVARKLQTEWENNYSGRGLGRTAVLSNGLEYKPMTVNAADSELVQQLRWTVENIARVYRVPSYMVGEMSKATYRNSEQQARDYVRQCLGYHIRAFEQCMTRALALGPGVEVAFDLSELYRMETDVRYANHQIALQSGFKTINEVRWDEDMPPVPGGDEPRVQMQYVTLSQADELAQAEVDAAKQTAKPKPAKMIRSIEPVEPELLAAPEEDDGQMSLDFTVDPIQMELLVGAFAENFNLGDSNGA